MITKKIRGGRDTWVGSASPSKTHSGTTTLSVNNASSATSHALLMPGWKPPRGVTVISAKLQLRAYKASSGTRTLSAYRISEAWKVTRTNWNNKPAVTGSAATVDIGSLSDGDLVEFDVTSQLQTVANGGKFYGWRISTTATSAHSFYSMNAGKHNPLLVVQYAFTPSVPTGLVSGGVSTGTPYLHFDYDVFSGNLALASLEVQIDPNADATAPAWDSGTVTTTRPELDLAGTDYIGLADGATTFWRVRYTTTDGLTSPWSDWATFSRTSKGPVSIDAPGAPPNDLVTEPTPPILWTSSNQVRWQVIVTPSGKPSKILHNSGQQAGSDQSYTLPSKVLTTRGARYTVKVRAWDAVARVATPGDTTYAEATRDFTFDYSTATAPVTSLAMEQPPTGFPRARLRFQRATPPDSFIVERDGQVVVDDLDPADLLISGSSYVWEDWTAAPFTDHTWKMIPVVNGAAAAANPVATGRFRAPGVWVGDPAGGWYFNLVGEDVSGLVYGEDADVTPLFAGVTRKISSMRGIEGTVNGVLIQSEFDSRPMVDQLADVWSIKGRGQRVFRLLALDVNAPVLVGAVSPSPSSDFLEGIEQRRVSFSVWQQGELPFTPIAGA